MAAEREEAPPRRWYYSREQLSNSPSRADGVDPEKELRYRQDAASLIQDMGPKLNLNVLCMSTAIVYMHRFYMINSFKAFDRVLLATAALFLAAKVEEHPRKLEHVAKCSYSLVNRDKPDRLDLDVQSEVYTKLIDDITYHELVLLQTLGFDVQVKHPHPHVVQCMNLVGVSRDLSQAAFFLAHNSQLLTTFCLEHPPTVVACMCIHLTCAWKGLEIPRSSDDKNWWEYVDRSVTYDKLEGLATEFLNIVDKSPSRLKKRIQDNIRMAVEGGRPLASSSQGTSRHPSTPATPSLHHKHKDRPSSSQTRKQQAPPPSSGKSHPPVSQKIQRSSPPPPPPPIHGDRPPHSLPPDQQKMRKHKEAYHHHHLHHQNNSGGAGGMVNKQTTPSSNQHKHSLPKDSHYPKNKKIKMEEASSQPSASSLSKQSLSLSDYRQSKHHHHRHHGNSDPNRPPKQDRHHSSNHVSNKHHHTLPPLPPPLPLSEAPPPPPPPPPN
ncbi:PREDICTED: cyclin-T1-like isoform X1 [Amphimedon queenslandica]|uniref:Cyclin-like domain-containing protein n=2 Tax=Amphimedon queenslandica TaxID=400682 RepID=A0AAN0JEN6_AMPQE|nr:PREDICTED: cyclin-T1-like isoform X1 [Amphimedon queenslandica]|eukprot:XP_019855485.1 PREDICTED: cyclin-T1-like isoform X1 [Amphimedon queenslandica]